MGMKPPEKIANLTLGVSLAFFHLKIMHQPQMQQVVLEIIFFFPSLPATHVQCGLDMC